ncbi:carboxymuconolactone decarboxylase family protein [Bacillus massiliglaciei]|uniref:carboxymuconolactone decarboxylase family protein n=1 Tax=Bacillus massiliglaciei TaxID=1816693 RepID=UPI000DA60AC3|nr:carboxymuconolactone decarboxylase family protein [Bacillus massiliglaciei]
MNDGNFTEAARIKYKEGIGRFNEKLPGFVSQFNAFTEECFKEGALTQKQKQLIALGISIHAQDEYCIIYHAKGCLEQGCSEQEILEAVCVTAALGGGASVSQGVTLVQDCLNEMN